MTKFEIEINSVCNYIQNISDHKINKRERNKTRRLENIKKAKSLKKQGMKAIEISRELGISRSSIDKYLAMKQVA